MKKNAMNFFPCRIRLLLFALGLCALWLSPLTSAKGQGTGQATAKPQATVQKELPFRAVENISSPAGWKRYHFGDPVVFSAILPRNPMVITNPLQSEEGGIHIFMATDGTSVYGVGYLQVREENEKLQQQRVQNFLVGLFDGAARMAKEMGITDEPKLSEIRRAKVDRLDGYEQEAVIGQLVITARAATLGDDLYAVYVMRRGEGTASDRNAFFNSFQIRVAR